ncbi:armadillo repeat-containing protein 2-like isoform X1 [Pecten maximus]|uniref:armadillo repeat-containing protein 2-like isoform X1 n=1 Tax=Pecten maximus TaxID=6579 RepID=UPI001458C185|nr:armadillo repeat-containing protein 2-like isoform X1 [Pecten maximus]
MMDQATKRNKGDRPFYQPPENIPTSAEIVNDARQSIGRPLQVVKTKRPFTPREDRRSLFGPTSTRNPETRPPSAFSLTSRHFDGVDSRPASGTKLSPLPHRPSCTSINEEQTPRLPTEPDVEVLLPPKPPTDPNKASRKVPRARVIHSNSVDASSPESLGINKSGSLTDLSKQTEGSTTDSNRRTHSGPKERTPIPKEERGEGDGKEMPHRAPSQASVRSPPRSASSREVESRASSGGTKRTSSAGSTGRGGSAGKRDAEESQEETMFYTQNIAPRLEELVHLGKKREGEKLCECADSLYKLLQRENLLGKNCKQRSTILKSVFKLLDLEEPKVLLRVARLILAFRVSGNNLLNVCKLVFKVSRNEKNDPEFLRGNILELLSKTLSCTDHTSSCEALIYCVGAIKFLTGNTTIVKQLVKENCIEGLGQLLDGINKTNRENGKVNEQLGHILVQLTAALRNLADANSSREKFLNCHIVEGLCTVVDTYAVDGDLMLNISRIFSKITLHTDCCTVLADQPSSYKSFIHLLNKHLQKSDMVVRVCFVLGNITAKNDEARVRLFQENKAFDVLLSVLKLYLEMDLKAQGKEEKSDDGERGNKLNKREDVMIKVVRVIANLSINETVGPLIASNAQCIDLLLSILEYKDIPTSEELVLNTVATINNLSYYSVKTSIISQQQMRVIEALLKLVLADNMEGMIEASRVFGNLTRQKTVRDFLVQHKVDQMMVTMLDSGNREVVYISCGVLINFMVDEEKRPALKKEGGVKKLIEVLRDFGRTDWELASLVCQILWNYSGKITSTNACFGEQEAQDLLDLLIEYTDQDSALDSSFKDEETDEEMKKYYYETWREFYPVAEQLLHRLETHQSDFEPLENPGAP